MDKFYSDLRERLGEDQIWGELANALIEWRTQLCTSTLKNVRRVIHVGASCQSDPQRLALHLPRNADILYAESTSEGATVLRKAFLTAGALAPAVRFVGLSQEPNGAIIQDCANLYRKRRVPDASELIAGWQLVSAPPWTTLGELVGEHEADLVVLDEMGLVADAILSIPRSGLAGAPAILMASAEAPWAPVKWRDALAALAERGYATFDPAGKELPIEGHVPSYSWFALSLPASRREGEAGKELMAAFEEAAGQFRDALLKPIPVVTVAPAPYTVRCEIVSLRTCALASGAVYEDEPCDEEVFDIYDRQMKPRSRPVEAARFRRVDVLPGAMWKICVDERYYVDEIGYSARGELFRTTTFPDWDGRTVAFVDRAVLKRLDVPTGAILFGGDAAYYHWILNWLPRLRAVDLIKRRNLGMEPLHFIISERIPEGWLDYFSMILDCPFGVTRIPEHGVWRFDDIDVPSFCTSHELHASIPRWYRKTLRIPQHVGRRRYYLSRQDARVASTPRRKVTNEDEVMEALSPFGFEPLLLGRADARRQVELFSEAEFVVGPHGAAFANMQFTPAGAKALVLENEWNHTFMADMLTVAGHNASVLVCRDVIDATWEATQTVDGVVSDEARRSRDMVVDTVSLLARVRAMLMD